MKTKDVIRALDETLRDLPTADREERVLAFTKKLDVMESTQPREPEGSGAFPGWGDAAGPQFPEDGWTGKHTEPGGRLARSEEKKKLNPLLIPLIAVSVLAAAALILSVVLLVKGGNQTDPDPSQDPFVQESDPSAPQESGQDQPSESPSQGGEPQPSASPSLGGETQPSESPSLGGETQPSESPSLGGETQPSESLSLGGETQPSESPSLGGETQPSESLSLGGETQPSESLSLGGHEETTDQTETVDGVVNSSGSQASE